MFLKVIECTKWKFEFDNNIKNIKATEHSKSDIMSWRECSMVKKTESLHFY